MSFLLDTHALLWWLLDDKRLKPKARDSIESGSQAVLFSPVNVYEIAYKVKLGKLDLDPRISRDLPSRLAEQGLAELPVSARHANAAGMLAIAHRDPFDRLLIAQALIEGLTLISNETLFDEAGVQRLWN